jgi:hypothetical protein
VNRLVIVIDISIVEQVEAFFCYCLYINITKDLFISNDSGNPVDQNTSFDDKEMFRKSYVINVINEYSD